MKSEKDIPSVKRESEIDMRPLGKIKAYHLTDGSRVLYLKDVMRIFGDVDDLLEQMP